VDGFETITERHGHPGADEVLRGVGQFLVNNCRVEDVNCRFVGGQFGIVAPNTGGEGTVDLANRLCTTLAHSQLTCRGQKIQVTCSFGLCDLEMAGNKSIVEMTEQAMQRARKGGGNRVEIHRPSLAA